MAPGEAMPAGASAAPEILRVLIVEDETLVAMLLEDMLADLGCTVVGPATRVASAVELARAETFDVAILDVNVAGEEIYPVAEVLSERDIPFVFATGYGNGGVSEMWRDRPTVQKPFLRVQIEDVLKRALATRTS
jgi:CheY-like chemotaxis protein